MSKVLTGNSYPYSFNTPRNSKHLLSRTKFILYQGRFWRPAEGIALWKPLKEKHDLIHTFNGIVLTKVPWIVTFESILPRTIGRASSKLQFVLREKLLQENCKQIIAISDYALRRFEVFNQDWQSLDVVKKKIIKIPPNVILYTDKPKKYTPGEVINLVFIGNDFARKGGVVALRVADKAKGLGLPIRLHIISSMNYGPQVYTDCFDKQKYNKDLELLTSSNIVFHGEIPNSEVLDILGKSHFHLLPTLDDTYGYSVLESFSCGTPVITTNVCALPEIVHNAGNGIVVDLEITSIGQWELLKERSSNNYWNMLSDVFESLADQIIIALSDVINNPHTYNIMSEGAIRQISSFHHSGDTGMRIDNIYSECI